MRFASIIFFAALFILELGCDSETPIVMQPPPDPEILIAHNKWRSVVGVADLEWSEDLANKAMALLNGSTCELFINTEGLGQNGSHSFGGLNAEEVIDIWASNIQFYDYDSDSCTALIGNCESYKQIVWANSTSLGCASATCFNNSTNTKMWVCLYDPPGNIPGERPY